MIRNALEPMPAWQFWWLNLAPEQRLFIAAQYPAEQDHLATGLQAFERNKSVEWYKQDGWPEYIYRRT